MKFKAARTEFADAAQWSLRTVGMRATLPALSGVLLEVAGDRLTLRSTDLEVSSELSIPVQAQRDGIALVPGRLLGDVVRSLPNDAVLAEATGDRLQLTCGRASFELRLMGAEDFPPLPQPAKDAAAAVMAAHEFVRTIGQVGRAAATEDARPQLTGVSLEATPGSLTAAATDSYRLAVRTVPWDQQTETTALVPRRALQEAQRAAEQLGGELRLILEATQATFAFADRRLTTRLIEGKYPNFRQLIPEGYERRLFVDRSALTEVVKRVAVVGDTDRSTVTPVRLRLTADAIVVSGRGEVGQAEESLPGRLEGEDLEIAFNPRLLTDGLDAAGGDEVVMELRDELKPAVLRAVAPPSQDGAASESVGDFLYLLMPMRI